MSEHLASVKNMNKHNYRKLREGAGSLVINQIPIQLDGRLNSRPRISIWR